MIVRGVTALHTAGRRYLCGDDMAAIVGDPIAGLTVPGRAFRGFVHAKTWRCPDGLFWNMAPRSRRVEGYAENFNAWDRRDAVAVSTASGRRAWERLGGFGLAAVGMPPSGWPEDARPLLRRFLEGPYWTDFETGIVARGWSPERLAIDLFEARGEKVTATGGTPIRVLLLDHWAREVVVEVRPRVTFDAAIIEEP